MKNEAQVATGSRAGTGRDGRGRARGKRIESSGIGAVGTNGGSIGRDGEPGPGRDRAAAIHAAVGTLGTAPVENRGQLRRYQRKSATTETASKGSSPTPTTTKARAGKAATPAGPEAEAPNSPEQEISGPAFEVQESRELSPNTPKWAKWKSGKKAKEQAEQTALTLLTILDGAIGMTLGPECAMTPDEHRMIDEPLARILARMAPETTELIDRWTDPLLLATGLVMWGARVFLVLSREVRREAKKNKPAMTQPESAEPSGGLDLNHPIQATGIPVEVAEALG